MERATASGDTPLERAGENGSLFRLFNLLRTERLATWHQANKFEQHPPLVLLDLIHKLIRTDFPSLVPLLSPLNEMDMDNDEYNNNNGENAMEFTWYLLSFINVPFTCKLIREHFTDKSLDAEQTLYQFMEFYLVCHLDSYTLNSYVLCQVIGTLLLQPSTIEKVYPWRKPIPLKKVMFEWWSKLSQRNPYLLGGSYIRKIILANALLALYPKQVHQSIALGIKEDLQYLIPIIHPNSALFYRMWMFLLPTWFYVLLDYSTESPWFQKIGQRDKNEKSVGHHLELTLFSSLASISTRRMMCHYMCYAISSFPSSLLVSFPNLVLHMVLKQDVNMLSSLYDLGFLNPVYGYQPNRVCHLHQFQQCPNHGIIVETEKNGGYYQDRVGLNIIICSNCYHWYSETNSPRSQRGEELSEKMFPQDENRFRTFRYFNFQLSRQLFDEIDSRDHYVLDFGFERSHLSSLHYAYHKRNVQLFQYCLGFSDVRYFCETFLGSAFSCDSKGVNLRLQEPKTHLCKGYTWHQQQLYNERRERDYDDYEDVNSSIYDIAQGKLGKPSLEMEKPFRELILDNQKLPFFQNLSTPANRVFTYDRSIVIRKMHTSRNGQDLYILIHSNTSKQIMEDIRNRRGRGGKRMNLNTLQNPTLVLDKAVQRVHIQTIPYMGSPDRFIYSIPLMDKWLQHAGPDLVTQMYQWFQMTKKLSDSIYVITEEFTRSKYNLRSYPFSCLELKFYQINRNDPQSLEIFLPQQFWKSGDEMYISHIREPKSEPDKWLILKSRESLLDLLVTRLKATIVEIPEVGTHVHISRENGCQYGLYHNEKAHENIPHVIYAGNYIIMEDENKSFHVYLVKPIEITDPELIADIDISNLDDITFDSTTNQINIHGDLVIFHSDNNWFGNNSRKLILTKIIHQINCSSFSTL